jgi:uncharacterized repeat protein (TIGR03803 family)
VNARLLSAFPLWRAPTFQVACMKLTRLIMVLAFGSCVAAPRLQAAALYAFNNAIGSFAGPNGLIVTSNVLYGTTRYAITTNGWTSGAVFRLNTDGLGFTNLHTFGFDGAPYAGVISSDGMLYGTTFNTIFAMRADGSEFTTLFTFPRNVFGLEPSASLVMSGNTLYGTADFLEDGGVVFAIDTNGSNYRVLHAFTPAPSGTNYDGGNPMSALILSEGVLYGTASKDGQFGGGTVFKLNTNGSAFETLHDFAANDGTNPVGGLVISVKTLYGTTQGGSGYGTVYSLNTDGTGFKVLHRFNGSDGGGPVATLVLKGGALYGTATWGGTNSNGTVFFLNADGTGFKTLYNFSPSFGLNTPTPWNADGWAPGPLVLLGTNLFGVCLGGGAGLGTIFTVPISTSAAQLNIARSGDKVVAMWPTGPPGYSLQYATNLSSPIWSSIASSAVVVNGQNAVTNAIFGKQMFLRLSQ